MTNNCVIYQRCVWKKMGAINFEALDTIQRKFAVRNPTKFRVSSPFQGCPK